MSQLLPYKHRRFSSQVSLKEIHELDDYAETGYFEELDMKYED